MSLCVKSCQTAQHAAMLNFTWELFRVLRLLVVWALVVVAGHVMTAISTTRL